MSSLTDTQLKQIGNFNTDTVAALKADLLYQGDVDALSAAGACSLTRVITELTIAGTLAFTLAAPDHVGQKKVIRCVAATSTPKGTLTITSPDDTAGFVCSATFQFDNVGQEITLEATSALKWRATSVKRAGGATDGVVVGTTVLTGVNLWERYCLSVTGTVSSTGTKALPNGSAVGERCLVSCTTAATTPIGNINATVKGPNGTAYTDIGAVGVAASATVMGDFAELEWHGSAWAVVNMSGVTFS